MQVIQSSNRPIKMWTDGVPVEADAIQQLRNIAGLPFIFKHLAVMPDVHLGLGATVGSVIATKGAIIPASVGVDIGCGLTAIRTSLKASDLPDSLKTLREKLEDSIPVGFAMNTHSTAADSYADVNDSRGVSLASLVEKHPILEKMGKDIWESAYLQMGTLGGGNHFIEICLDTNDFVWIMLHSGSRGIGNIIGRYFIELARNNMEKRFIGLPDKDLAYLCHGDKDFDDYIEAVSWAQRYAFQNRKEMLDRVIKVMRSMLPEFTLEDEAINCHHNYIAQENHYGENVYVTRKGAVRARQGDMGIIPGSMGAKSFIVCGKGHTEAFCSCSHGAGRVMSRSAAKEKFTLEDHAKATEGVECRKDEGVIDETPAAYKDIDAVMAAQADLVDIKYTLKQILCIKG